MARPDPEERARAEAPGAEQERIRRGGADDLAPRRDRWRAQLGLPDLLAPRLDIRDGPPARSRVHGRSGGVLLVADACVSDNSSADAGAIPDGRGVERTRAAAPNRGIHAH